MKDDYTTNFHHLTYTFICKRLGECTFYWIGSERAISLSTKSWSGWWDVVRKIDKWRFDRWPFVRHKKTSLSFFSSRRPITLIVNSWPFHPQVQKVHSPNLLKDQCISKVVRIGSIIIFYSLSKLWKDRFSIQCDVLFLVWLQEKPEIDPQPSASPHTQSRYAATALLRATITGQNYMGHPCRMQCLDDRSFFIWKQTFFGPNSTFSRPLPHAMLFVRKGLLKSRPTTFVSVWKTIDCRGREEGGSEYCTGIWHKRQSVPHILARIVWITHFHYRLPYLKCTRCPKYAQTFRIFSTPVEMIRWVWGLKRTWFTIDRCPERTRNARFTVTRSASGAGGSGISHMYTLKSSEPEMMNCNGT